MIENAILIRLKAFKRAIDQYICYIYMQIFFSDFLSILWHFRYVEYLNFHAV